MNNNEKFMEALERIDKLNNELRKIKNMIKCIQEGQEVLEDFDDEIFMEDSDTKSVVRSKLTRIIEHLFKIKYSTSTMLIDGWIHEIEYTFRRDIQDRIDWFNEPNKNVLKDLTANLQKIYESAIRLYNSDASKYSDLVAGINQMPKECPWTFAELMELDIDELLKKL